MLREDLHQDSSLQDMTKCLKKRAGLNSRQTEAMCAALQGALRPQLDVNDIAEDLRMLAKQNASLSEMESVLAESVTVLPTREMRDALRRLYEGTPRWLGLKAALEH